MKNKTITMLTIATAACVHPAVAESTPSANQLQVFQKNLARQHLSSNLFLFDSAKQQYVATEAAAAWLDDDITTGWPALAGKQHYVLQFSEPQVLTNFSLSAVPVDGTVTLYSSDELKNPGDTSWRVVAKDLPVSSLNQKRIGKGFNRQAKYLLIETNIANPGPVYSVYAYGSRAAANDSIIKRAASVDVGTLLGEFVNDRTGFNVTSLYSQSRVTYSNGSSAPLNWQKSIDDSAESGAVVKSSADSGMVVSFGESRTVSRIGMLTDADTKGKVEVFLLAEAPAGGHPVALEGVAPSVTLTFDGSNSRAVVDFDDTTAVALALRWIPHTADQDLNIRELNTFANLSLADYEVAGAPVAIAEAPTQPTESKPKSEELPSENSENAVASESKRSSDGKEIMPIGEGKETVDYKGGGKEIKQVEPIGEPPKPGYFPGGLGFPPNLSRNPVVLVPPRTVKPPTSKPLSP